MKLYTIKHKETGKTLKQYVQEKLKNASQYYFGEFWQLRDRSLSYLCSESGTPGYSYYIDYEGIQIVWLDSKIWEVEFRQHVLDKRKVV